MSTRQGISVAYLSVGSGHQIAAQALEAAIRRENPELPVRALDPFSASMKILPFLLEQAQAFSIMVAPGLYDAYWGRRATGDLFLRLAEKGLLDRLFLGGLGQHERDIVIATHVVPCVAGVALKRRTGMVRHVYGVITDLGAHAYWPVRGVDGYFVANDETRTNLISRGAEPDNVHVTGIPIRLFFERAQGHRRAIDGEKLRVLMMAGALKRASYLQIRRYLYRLLRTLRSSLQGQIELSIITGGNHRLRNRVVAYADRIGAKVSVFGVVEDMCEMLLGHDLLITKPGGLILSEALACGTCPILLGGGAGQERANADWVMERGVGFQADSVEEVVQAIRRCQHDPSLIERMLKEAKSLGRPNAAAAIARQVLELSYKLVHA
ncbi:MAG: glycosyltransferase [Anaerolineales bacterium]|jgi:processive 1,2-diacylglycerol beta-glucosyltransferase